MNVEKVTNAEEFFYEFTGCPINHREIKNVMIEFAKIHVEAALKAAIYNAETKIIKYTDDYEVDKHSILSSYPLENIK